MSRDLCNGMLAGAQSQYERERFGEDLHPVMRAALGHFALPRGSYPAKPAVISDTISVPYRGASFLIRHEGQRPQIAQVFLNGMWFDAVSTLAPEFVRELQSSLDAMPSNS